MRTTSAFRLFKTVALALSLVVGLTLSLAPSATAAAGSDRDVVVAQNDLGKITSRIVGTTADGSRVTGSFTPQKFIERGDQMMVRGVVDGVVHQGDATQSFTATRTFSVAAVQGLECGILDLVLGPLDLDLLGLQIHLDQVVLTILAVTGANNLLGNLLCAVTGLLDGVAIIGQIIALLNEILDLFWPAA